MITRYSIPSTLILFHDEFYCNNMLSKCEGLFPSLGRKKGKEPYIYILSSSHNDLFPILLETTIGQTDRTGDAPRPRWGKDFENRSAMLVYDPYGLPISIMDVYNAIATRTAAGQKALRPRRNEHFGNGGYIYNKPATLILTLLHEYLLDQRSIFDIATKILPSVPITKASRRYYLRRLRTYMH